MNLNVVIRLLFNIYYIKTAIEIYHLFYLSAENNFNSKEVVDPAFWLKKNKKMLLSRQLEIMFSREAQQHLFFS